jgi:hypothetical protein
MHPAMMGKARATKPKKCAMCGKQYTPRAGDQPFEVWCSIACGVELGRERAEKALLKRQAKELRERKVTLKPRSKWLQEAQQAVNAYVRERDYSQPCIACQRHHTGQYHAGHYRSVGAMPSLRFNTWNIHKSCSACNAQLSGNLIEYRINLIKKVGSCRVEWLEGPHETRKFDIVYLRRVKAIFTRRTRQLARRRAHGT